MDTNPSKNRSQNEFLSDDIISNLPDHILGQILSHLRLKDVIVTSILSTRWKTLFPNSVPLIELDLDDSHKSKEGNNSSSSSRIFVDFVDKLLNVTLRDVPIVKKVVLNCDKEYDDDKIVSWVCASLRLNVEHLRLMSHLNDSKALFDSLNGCTTLVKLELGNNFDWCLPQEFILPNLKRLSLYTLLPRYNMDLVHKLIDGCPVLEDLTIVGSYFVLLDTFYVKYPYINKLFIEHWRGLQGCRVVLDVPNIEAFAYQEHFVENYIVNNSKFLHSVNIDFDYFGEETDGKEFGCKARLLAKLVSECSSTPSLFLSGNSLMALYHSSVSPPTFQNLTRLTLGRTGGRGWRNLARLLNSAPNLTMLGFEEELKFTEVYAGFKSVLPSFPFCLERSLTSISISEFGWTSDEIQLIEYFLQNGRVLQGLSVYCLPHEDTYDLEKLSMLPRHSKACSVTFWEKHNGGNSSYSRGNWF